MHWLAFMPFGPGKTWVHASPDLGAAAGQAIGPGARQLQAWPMPPLGAFWQVHWVVPNVQRFAPLPPGTAVHVAPVAGAASGHITVGAQAQVRAVLGLPPRMPHVQRVLLSGYEQAVPPGGVHISPAVGAAAGHSGSIPAAPPLMVASPAFPARGTSPVPPPSAVAPPDVFGDPAAVELPAAPEEVWLLPPHAAAKATPKTTGTNNLNSTFIGTSQYE